jgi:hypothetical protein
MNAILAESGLRYALRIIPFEDGWLVAFKGGRYAIPLEKREAIKQASALALEIKAKEIAVCDALGTVTEVVPVWRP